MTQQRANPRKWFPGPSLAIFAVALGIRLFYLWQIDGSPVATVLFGDGEAYDIWAKRIAAGDWVGSEAFYQAPLYPYFLAVLYAVAGPGMLVVRLVQALLGSLACVFVARAGGVFFGAAAGVTAGLLLAAYPIAIYFDGSLQKTSLESFLMALLLWLIAELAQRAWAGPRLWLAAGIVLGLLGLVRENTLILAPLLLGRAVWPWGPRARASVVAVFLAGIACVLLPVGFRNLAVGGSFHLTTYQLGTNLFIGNNPSANGIYVPLTEGGGNWRRERADAVRLAEKAEGRSLTPAEVSRYWMGRAVSFAAEHPGAWLRLMARKMALVWNRVEVGDHDSPDLFADASSLLRALLRVWHFGVLCPLAALGFVLAWASGRRPWLLFGVLLALAASVATFYVFGRYRFSLVPVLVLPAGAGLVELARSVRGRSIPGRTWGIAAVVTVLVAVGSNWTLVKTDEIFANAYYNLGWKLEGEERADGDAAAARRAYERALEIRPAYPDALNNLGNLAARDGRIAEARERFAAAVAIDPRHANAQFNLGKALLAEGKPADALPHLELAVRSRHDDPLARERLAKALFGVGRPADAIPHYQEVARLSPTPANHNNLGSALAAAGRLREASREFQAALDLDPEFAEAHENIALTYLHLRELETAAVHYGEVVRLRPGSESARQNLERVRGMLQGSRPRR